MRTAAGYSWLPWRPYLPGFSYVPPPHLTPLANQSTHPRPHTCQAPTKATQGIISQIRQFIRQAREGSHVLAYISSFRVYQWLCWYPWVSVKCFIPDGRECLASRPSWPWLGPTVLSPPLSPHQPSAAPPHFCWHGKSPTQGDPRNTNNYFLPFMALISPTNTSHLSLYEYKCCFVGVVICSASAVINLDSHCRTETVACIMLLRACIT